jgi:hypothetical protein
MAQRAHKVINERRPRFLSSIRRIVADSAKKAASRGDAAKVER